mmetsp:Transcript_20132/g.29213  ORF Transcript_20132/g.29213 Transcript_20132/m.29213 type:complete len:139 (+) Transcript_20132:79-495(+)
MEDAARAWSLELTRAGTNLAHATHQLQSAFEEYSSKSVSLGGEKIPDPIELLERIAALESSIALLQVESQDISNRRVKLVEAVTESLSKNVLAISNVSRFIGTGPIIFLVQLSLVHLSYLLCLNVTPNFFLLLLYSAF